MKQLSLRWALAVGLLASSLQAVAQSTGNVGVGTPTPTQTLDVNGTLRVRALTGPANRLPLVKADGTLGVNDALPDALAAMETPTQITGAVGTTSGPQAIVVASGTAYIVSEGSNKMQVFDVRDLRAPLLLSTVSTAANPGGLAVSGTLAVVTHQTSTALQVFDVSVPTAPVVRSTITLAANSYVHNVSLIGTTAYVQENGGLLKIFDLTTPTAPVLLGSVSTGGRGLTVSGGVAYVIGTANTLRLYDVTTPSAPALLGSVATNPSSFDVKVVGGRAYVAQQLGPGQMQIFDVTTPSAPTLLGTATTPGIFRGVAVRGTLAFVACTGGEVLQVFDVANPSAPLLLSSIATGGPTRYVDVDESAAYVVNQGSGGGLKVVALRSSARPVVVNPDGSLASVPPPAAPLSSLDVVLNGTTAQAASFNVSGTGRVGGALTAGAGLTVTGALAANGGATVTGGATVSGALTANNAATVTGLLTANGGATVAGTLRQTSGLQVLSVASAAAPTSSSSLAPTTGIYRYTDNANTGTNGTVALSATGAVDGQLLHITNVDAQALPVSYGPTNGLTVSIPSMTTARFVFTGTIWTREL